jgi:hypothetical protein
MSEATSREITEAAATAHKIGTDFPSSHQSAQLSRLIENFERGDAPNGFHHSDHVRMAFEYVTHFPFLEAVERFCTALKRFAAKQGKPQLFHETITWTYLMLIRERHARDGGDQKWEEFARNNADLLVWKGGVLDLFYSKEVLGSDLARRIFIFPDLVDPSDDPSNK